MGLLLVPVFEEFPWYLVDRHTEECQGSHQDMDQMLKATKRGVTLQLGMHQLGLPSFPYSSGSHWCLQKTLGSFWRHFCLLQLTEGEMCYNI